MNKKTWIAFFAVAATLITILAIYLLYTARENEHKLRLSKEAELSRKVAELGEKQQQILTLIKQKSELEEQFNTKISTLEASARDHDDSAKALNAKMESVLRENEALKRDIEDKDKKISELFRKIRSLEADKTQLLETINKGPAKPLGSEEGTGLSDAGIALDPANPEGLGSVKLGKIVVQKTSGRAARVEYIDKLYGFIVINAGSKDGLKPESVINIVRGNKLIGKAVVQKIRPDVAAAVLVSEGTKDDVKLGDLISRFS